MAETTGLRERKRVQAMRRVQDTALDLFDQHGYARVTIEQIADRAEVSASSVYRYFATKEGVLLWNPHHEQALGQLRDQPDHDETEPLVTTFRRMTAAVLADGEPEEGWQRRRLHYLLGEPSTSAALIVRMEEMGREVAELLARRSDRAVDDLEVQVTIGAMVGGLFAAMRSWRAGQHVEPLAAVIDTALATLQDGLPLLGDS